MADYPIQRIRRPLSAVLAVPGSKSLTNRAMLMAALASGTSTLRGALFSDDSRYFLESLKILGIQTQTDEAAKEIRICGLGGRIPNTGVSIYTGSAGTASRFLTALLALRDGTWTVNCSEQMSRRPMHELFEALSSLGASFSFTGDAGHLPAVVHGCGCPGVEVQVATDKSTQFLSALLMNAPVLPQGLHIRTTGKRADGAYVKITERMMRQFGCGLRHETGSNEFFIPGGQVYQARQYAVEPDVSAACYFYAAAAVCGGSVTVKGLHADTLQGDIRFLDVLREAGCIAEDTEEGIRVTGPGPGKLRGVDVNMKDFSDQALTLAAIAPFADGITTIRGIGHIRLQESDRIHACVTELSGMGIRAEESADGIRIWPGPVRPHRVNTYEDHRVAMAFAVTGLAADGIVIGDGECTGKTFENFFDTLALLHE